MKKTYYWVVGVLIALNLALLLVVWQGHKHLPPPHKGGMAAKQFLIEELSLSSEQQLDYEKLIRVHQEQLHEIREQTHELKKQLFGNMSAIDSLEENRLERAIADLQIQQDKITLAHFRTVRNTVCTPAQQKKFDQLLLALVERIGRPIDNMPPPRKP